MPEVASDEGTVLSKERFVASVDDGADQKEKGGREIPEW